MTELEDVERRHHVSMPFACESRSRGRGFASPPRDPRALRQPSHESSSLRRYT
ncbi:hypothetical protein [Burkholderia sp. B21-007]|uniref:hypothetical protein n=1 Tax=Burkholderia TaxID=32008 RepID=UPI003A5CFE1A